MFSKLTGSGNSSQFKVITKQRTESDPQSDFFAANVIKSIYAAKWQRQFCLPFRRQNRFLHFVFILKV